MRTQSNVVAVVAVVAVVEVVAVVAVVAAGSERVGERHRLVVDGLGLVLPHTCLVLPLAVYHPPIDRHRRRRRDDVDPCPALHDCGRQCCAFQLGGDALQPLVLLVEPKEGPKDDNEARCQ